MHFFFLNFFVPSHTVKAQTARRVFLFSLTDCMHSALVTTRGGRPSFWPRFLTLTQRGGSSPFWPHFLTLSATHTTSGVHPPLSAHSLALDPMYDLPLTHFLTQRGDRSHFLVVDKGRSSSPLCFSHSSQ